jgi:hypothetical protein
VRVLTGPEEPCDPLGDEEPDECEEPPLVRVLTGPLECATPPELLLRALADDPLARVLTAAPDAEAAPPPPA